MTHGATDAPALDVTIRETGLALASDLLYAQASAPVALAPGTYTVDVARASDGSVLASRMFTFDASDTSLAFQITGFLNPAANMNGPALAITGVDASGSTETGQPVASEDALTLAPFTVGPNPVATSATVRFTTTESGPVRLTVVDLLGRDVATLIEGPLAAGPHATAVDVARWAPGVYVVRLTAEGGSRSARLAVAR